MSDLRTVKVRAENISQPWDDLRGLKDPELFQASGFTVHLRLRGVTLTTEQVTQLEDTYQVRASADGAHWTSADHRPGTHKVQALRLFYAALELLSTHPEAHACIHQTQGLAELLEARISEHVESVEPEWRHSNAPLILDPAVSLALVHAGVFQVFKGYDGLHEITSSQLGEIHQSVLVEPERGGIDRRKAG